MNGVAGAAASVSRISYVDGLRAIAVLSVIVFHATLPHSPAQPQVWTFVFSQGCHGVDLFFVLSGFCLAYPTLRGVAATGASSFDVRRYAVRRFVRIVPPFYIAIALLYVAFLLFGRYAGPVGDITPAQVLRQALFIDSGTHFLNPSFWTLPIEFRWYFLFPFALWLWIRSPRAFAGAAIVAGLLMTRVAVADLIVLPGFLLGIVAAHIRVRRYALAWLALPAFVVMLAVCLAFFPNRTAHGEVGPAWEIAAFFLVVGAGAIPRIERLFATRILVAVGIASYGIYLVHQPVIVLAQRFGWQWWMAGLAGVGVGFLFWWLAERPFVKGHAREILVARLELGLTSIASAFRRTSAASLHTPQRREDRAASSATSA